MDDLRNISDTARWVAWYRALESERKDAWFHDPFARRLAGDRGQRIASGLGRAGESAWGFVTRTVVIDRYVSRCIGEGATVVVNLAAGLDTRPYRMTLPSSLRWVEVDLPEMLDYKTEMLKDERPACALERVPLDLANRDARRQLLERLGGPRTLVITEGLVIYLSTAHVVNLAEDLARTDGFAWWSLDMVSPRLMKRLQKSWGAALADAGAPFGFAPEMSTAFFEPLGWQLSEVHSLLHTAAALKRLPLGFRVLAALAPDPGGRKTLQPWSGVCLFTRALPTPVLGSSHA